MATRIRELMEKRTEVLSEIDSLLKKAEDDNKRALTQEEEDKYNELMDLQQSLKDEADGLQKRAKLEALRSESNGNAAPEQRATATAANAGGESHEELQMKAFRAYLQGGIQEVERLETRALNTATFADGGAIVAPPQFVSEFLKKLQKVLVFRQLARSFTLTSSQSLGVPTLESGATAPEWTNELPAADPTVDAGIGFGGRELRPNSQIKEIQISNALLRLAILNPESLVMDEMVRVFAEAEENAYINGDGVKKPLGVYVASDQGISTDRDVTLAKLDFDNLIDMKYTLDDRYVAAARWLLNKDIVKVLRKIKDGEGRYIWQGAIAAGEPDMLLDVPVVRSTFAPKDTGSGKYVALLGDFSYYWIADALPLKITRLVELLARRRKVGFLGEKETDGMPVLEEAFVRGKMA